VIVTDAPAHIESIGGVAVIVGIRKSVIVIESFAVQPTESVPVTVYVFVANGPALGLGHEVQLKPNAGNHV
jgi:hypothetical protein